VWEAYHTLLYTESPVAPGSVQKAAVMDPRRVVTGRLAGCKEELSGQAAVKIPGRCRCGVGSLQPNSGAG
jgi:hypothetical protein